MNLMTISPLLASNPMNVVWEFFIKGGPVMVPLVMTSVIGVAAIIYKILSLRRERILPKDLVGKWEAFDELSNDDCAVDTSLGRLARVALRQRGKSSKEITRSVEIAARQEVLRLYAGIQVLDIVIAVAPLLGLLGTAGGLVAIFKGLGETSDNTTIAHGISEALHCTIFGLAVAVPCVIAHGHFTRQIETLTAQLEGMLASLADRLESTTHRR